MRGESMFVIRRFLIGALLMAHVAASWAQSTDACAALIRLKLDHTQIETAETVRGPTFMPPASSSGSSQSPLPDPLKGLPDFCRVSAVISPAIRFELWLPLTNWNGKFQGTGNGGYNGSIVYLALAEGLRRNYATSSTDMGHAATLPDPSSWALGHPELVVDQAYRAQHETAVNSKKIIGAFYRKSPRYSYFTGCSSGGWQGLTEAQRFPEDYDGILAGAPAINVIHLHAATLWNVQAEQKIAPGKYRLVTDAVLAKCDARDGVRDGLLADPLSCPFSPAELACKLGEAASRCLTEKEVRAFGMIYQGVRWPSGESIYPGWPLGSEYAFSDLSSLEWQQSLTALAAGTFKNMAFQDPSWDHRQIDFERDVRKADARIGAVVNAYSPDLWPFRYGGGKLILYHGWDDSLISARNTLEYYQHVAAFMTGARDTGESGSADIQDFARLFLMPGVHHCRGGPGPDQFDGLTALEQWVEQGVAPAQIVASHSTNGTVDRTRPLCPYPKISVYQNRGSTDEAKSFSCRVPERPSAHGS